MTAGTEILDVDLLAFERGTDTRRKAIVDGVLRSLRNGFVYTSHDISEGLLDEAYAMLAEFFNCPTELKERSVAVGSHGQRGYTGLLVETAADSDVADWKEMLNWGAGLPAEHPLYRKYPHRYAEPVFPEADVPGISAVLMELHERTFDVQRRFLRIIAVGLGAHESFFDSMIKDGTTLTRAIRYPPMSQAPLNQAPVYSPPLNQPPADRPPTDQAPGQAATPHVWAAAHGDINLITALPRATSRGLQVLIDPDRWVDAAPPEGHCIINTGIMLERLTNGVIPVGVHRVVADPEDTGERYSVVQFCHPTPWTVLAPMNACVNAEHPQKYAPIEAGDLLDQVIYDINLVDINPVDINPVDINPVEDGRRLDGSPTEAAN